MEVSASGFTKDIHSSLEDVEEADVVEMGLSGELASGHTCSSFPLDHPTLAIPNVHFPDDCNQSVDCADSDNRSQSADSTDSNRDHHRCSKLDRDQDSDDPCFKLVDRDQDSGSELVVNTEFLSLDSNEHKKDEEKDEVMSDRLSVDSSYLYGEAGQHNLRRLVRRSIVKKQKEQLRVNRPKKETKRVAAGGEKRQRKSHKTKLKQSLDANYF